MGMMMNEYIIRRLSYRDRRLVEEYKGSFVKNGENINGGLHLQYMNFSMWYFHVLMMELPYVFHIPLPRSRIYIVLNSEQNKMIGIINIRFSIHIKKRKMNGGDIGYSVLREERNKGIGTEILCYALKQCKRKPAIVMCAKDNIASNKVIIKVGGKIDYLDKDSKNNFYYFE